MQALNGTVSVSDAPGGEARFSLQFPAPPRN
jgi:signal transduction histidine kinase